MRFETKYEIDTYRVRQTTGHPSRWINRAWYGRTWQAEWPGVQWAPRAYTRRGIEWKSARWARTGGPRFPSVRLRRWWRKHVPWTRL